MSKVKKSLERLIAKPKDFTWKELQVVMFHFGYMELKGSGSRRKFINKTSKVAVSLHEPHPRPVMKRYAIELIIDHLKEEGFL